MRKKSASLSVLLICTVFMLFSSNVFATTTGNVFNGGSHTYDTQGGGVTAAFCYISYPTVPTVDSPSRSSAWDMLGTGTGTFYQVGWERDNGSSSDCPDNETRYFFEAYDGTNHVLTCSLNGPALGSTHSYNVYTYNGIQKGTVDGVLISSMASSLVTTKVYFCEELGSDTDTYKAHYGGSSSSHARFSNLIAYYNGSNRYSPSLDAWTSTNAGQTFSNYTVGTNSTSSYIQLWDTRD